MKVSETFQVVPKCVHESLLLRNDDGDVLFQEPTVSPHDGRTIRLRSHFGLIFGFCFRFFKFVISCGDKIEDRQPGGGRGRGDGVGTGRRGHHDVKCDGGGDGGGGGGGAEALLDGRPDSSPIPILLHKAMKYYRLWIYACNVVLLVGVIVFVVTAAVLLSDIRFRFVSVALYHPTFLYAYLALVTQSGVLQAVGCHGALRLNERSLNLYLIVMLLLLVGDVLVGLVWAVLFDGLANGLPTVLRTRLRTDYGSEPYYTADWNRLQEEFACCGVHGPEDFDGTPWTDARNESLLSVVVPNSCCVTVTSDLARNSSSVTKVTCDVPLKQKQQQQPSRTGCVGVVLDWMQHCADVLFVLGFCVIAFLKLCFIGILRYEIREMIQKIHMLQGNGNGGGEGAAGFTELMSSEDHCRAANDLNSSSAVTDGLLQKVSVDRKTQLRCASNGNNNDLELVELTNNVSLSENLPRRIQS